ncbi:MAG: alpha/beta hydrolase, partial [Roseivivax sp.]|nr:alpha/beta hydrolase [Roseivivax sp.]
MLRSAVIWLVALCLFVEPGAGRAQSGNLLLDLPYLAQTDPQAALARIEEELAALEASGAPDARLAFDLYRMAADLLVQTGRQADAADTLMALGQFAQAQRALLQADPAEHFAAAADLYRALGDWPAARAALEARLAEDRDGARPAEVIADDLRQLSDVAQQMADPAAADSYRAAAAAALAPVDSATRGTADGYRAVDVYYGTDRARSGRSGPDGFYGAGRGTLELGIATVTIPDVHVPGLVEKPSIWRLEFRADPARHVVLQSVTPLEADAFYTHLHGAVEQSQRKEAFVFIHGYNVSFDKAARRAAQIAYDMSFAGVPILYSWPSADSTVGYMADA